MSGPLLAVRDVSVQFDGLRALSDVSFTVARGELLALIGPNGAGKTTLLNVLGGEIKPTAGGVTYDGVPTNGLKPFEIVRKGLARSFQAAETFQHLSVRENVMVGGVPRARSSLLACLSGSGRTKLDAGAMRTEADMHLHTVGLLSSADAPASTLTAGQRRLLSIARILATGVQTLVLDEPGAGLNEREKAGLGDVILSLSETGRTILFVDHDMPLVSRIARRILVLDRGQLIADDEPDVVRANPKVVEAYLGVRKISPLKARPAAGASKKTPEPLLSVRDLHVNYAGLIAISKISIEVGEGELVALVGANGAGKSTLLRSIARLETCQAGELSFGGVDLRRVQTDRAVSLGISLVPEGRALFGSLTVAENLAAGRYARRRADGFRHVLWRSAEERAAYEERLGTVYDLFPILKERVHQLAGTLSGGQGQMLAIGRALMGAPRLLMLDEPSLGLAPQVVEEIFAGIERLRQAGLTILLVEQNIAAALAISDRAYVLANGAIATQGAGCELLEDPRITEAYLGNNHALRQPLPPRKPLAAAGGVRG
jgi:branched-chain amino acid transport system ATP-binding protein